MIQPAASSPGVTGSVPASSPIRAVPDRPARPMPAGRPQPGRPPSSSYASLLCAVMWRGLQREKSRMIPQTAIVQIAKKIGRELNSGAEPSEVALAAGPILAEAGATPEIVG